MSRDSCLRKDLTDKELEFLGSFELRKYRFPVNDAMMLAFLLIPVYNIFDKTRELAASLYRDGNRKAFIKVVEE
jgi:hypothetical protein